MQLTAQNLFINHDEFTMDHYEYASIPDLDQHSRVLHLCPGGPSDPLVGELCEMHVANPEPFEALSYCWGHNHQSETIIVNGKRIPITNTVATALRQIRLEKEHRVIWVDQVCVNQKDLHERSRQVQHMSSIYQNASNVLVWLGDDPNGHSGRAFPLITSLAAISQDPLLLQQFQAKQLQGDLDWFPSEHWVSLGELFKQPWFDRKWILQEIGTDAPSELIWGDYRVNWTHVSKAASLLKDHAYVLRRKYDVLAWKPWYMTGLFSPSSYKSKALNFTYEMHRARWQHSGDPRDHIFALLGHPAALRPDGTRVMEADYTKPVGEVYIEFTVSMLKSGSLMVLNTVQHGSIQASTERHNTPSWVTRWDSQDSLHNIVGDDTCAFRPSKEMLPHVEFLESNRALVMDGLVIDTVDTMSKTFDTSDVTLTSPALAEVWQSQPECEGGAFTTGTTYNDSQPALFAFLETISVVKKLKSQAPIPESQRLADGADFLVKAFGETHTIDDGVREKSQAGSCYKWMERASGGAKGRKFARGLEGYYALCPPATAPGDVLCLLFGGQTLYCLRPHEDGYQFVGECYVHGVMEGEALDMMEEGKLKRTKFIIR